MTWENIGAVIGMFGVIIAILLGMHRYNSNRRTRIYERLDETKEQIIKKSAEDYARKDICRLTHEQVDAKLKEIQAQTALIPRIAAQLEVLVNGRGKSFTEQKES